MADPADPCISDPRECDELKKSPLYVSFVRGPKNGRWRAKIYSDTTRATLDQHDFADILYAYRDMRGKWSRGETWYTSKAYNSRLTDCKALFSSFDGRVLRADRLDRKKWGRWIAYDLKRENWKGPIPPKPEKNEGLSHWTEKELTNFGRLLQKSTGSL